MCIDTEKMHKSLSNVLKTYYKFGILKIMVRVGYNLGTIYIMIYKAYLIENC